MPSPTRASSSNPERIEARGLRLGSLAGVEIRLDWSLLIIFGLITVILSSGTLPYWHPEWGTGLVWLVGALAAVSFLASVLVHELSHALVGRRLGMRIERITLFVFGGMAHLEEEPATWRTELGMAIVGPLTSLAIGVACLAAASSLVGPVQIDPEDPAAAIADFGPLATLLVWLGPVNILLALFNLVPGFPLDGGRVLRAILWGATNDLERATRWAARGGQAFAWLLILAGFAMILGIQVPVFGAGLVPGLWLALIGWFLNNAAVMSYRRLHLQRALQDVPVGRLMHRDFLGVAPEAKISDLVEERLLRSSQRVFPVQDGEHFLGLVCLQDVRRLAREAWDRTAVREVMTPRGDLHTLDPRDPASQALDLLARRDINQLPVLDDDRLVGMVTRGDIVKWMALNRREGLGEAGDEERLLGRPSD